MISFKTFFIFFNPVRPQVLSQVLVVSTLGILLSGCIGMSSKFDCNVDSGGRCASMRQINKMASYGAFNDQAYGSYGKVKKYNQEYPYIPFKDAPIRSNERIQQIWIGPYEDTNGNYHEASYMYTVVKKGRWIGLPDYPLKVAE